MSVSQLTFPMALVPVSPNVYVGVSGPLARASGGLIVCLAGTYLIPMH